MRIESTVHTQPTLSRDYGVISIEQYFNPWDKVKVTPTGGGVLPMTWTTRYDLEMGDPE